MSGKIGAVDSSYDCIGYKPKPSFNFFEEAVKALLQCLGAEAPSNTDIAIEQVVDEPPATASETEDDPAEEVPQLERVARPPVTPPPKPGGKSANT